MQKTLLPPLPQCAKMTRDETTTRIEDLVPELAKFASFDCEWYKEGLEKKAGKMGSTASVYLIALAILISKKMVQYQTRVLYIVTQILIIILVL